MTDQAVRSVTLTRVFNAPIALVFEAWTKTEHMTQWMRCDPGMEVSYEGWEPKVGTKFKTTMSKPGEWSNEGTGTVLEVDPPRLLVYTGDADEKMQMPEMTVRVELEEVDGGTKLTLTHSGMPNDMMCGIIEGGWTGGLKMLEDVLATLS